MIDLSPDVAFLCAVSFFAGFVDSIAGGGGLLQLPALFAVFPTVSPVLLLGTNKFSSIFGTAAAIGRYRKSMQLPWDSLVPASLLGVVGASIGAAVASIVDPVVFRPVLIGVLLWAGWHAAWPKEGLVPSATASQTSRRRQIGICALGFLVGTYDGFLGPGAGILLMLGLVRLLGYDLLTASAETKVINFATNAGALAIFLVKGSILFSVAVPMALFNVIGGALGAHLAVRRGTAFIRKVLVFALILLVLKLLLDILKS